MNDDEKLTFLANMFCVIRADGKINEKEIAAINTYAKILGCAKSSIAKAENKSNERGFCISPVGVFSEKVANLEAMLYAAIIDGAITEEEKNLILVFGENINIKNDQLQIIFSEAKARVVKDDYLKCAECSTQNAVSAKFCANCGNSLISGDTNKSVAISYEIPKTGIAIEFSESTASGFGDAVLKANKAPTSAICIKSKKTWYLASWPLNEIAAAASLVEDLKGMRNRKVWLDGKESRWDDIFGFTWCSQQRNSAYRPVEHCFGIEEKILNIWGCKHSGMNWTSWERWFSYGAFNDFNARTNEANFVFNKNKIRHELESNLYKIRLCPHLNFKLIEAVLEILPSEVKVSAAKNAEWKFKQDCEQTPGSILIKEVTANGLFLCTNEYYSSGIIPNGQEVGLKLLKMALEKIGMSNEGMQAVLAYNDEY
jgi:hypothetical protein